MGNWVAVIALCVTSARSTRWSSWTRKTWNLKRATPWQHFWIRCKWRGWMRRTDTCSNKRCFKKRRCSCLMIHSTSDSSKRSKTLCNRRRTHRSPLKTSSWVMCRPSARRPRLSAFRKSERPHWATSALCHPSRRERNATGRSDIVCRPRPCIIWRTSSWKKLWFREKRRWISSYRRSVK